MSARVTDRSFASDNSPATARPCERGAAGGSPLPLVFITRRDFGRLEPLARLRLESSIDAVHRFLAAELDRSIVCRDEDVPDDVVTMRSRVLFRSDTDRDVESRTLVYPRDYVPSGAVISILSPLGVALLGLRAGSTMTYATLQGASRRLTVEKVAYRPDLPYSTSGATCWRPPCAQP